MNIFTKTVGGVVVSLALTCGVQAAQAAEKVGYVNSQLVFQQMAKNAGLNTVIQREFKTRINEVEGLKKSFNSKAQNFQKNAPLMSDDDKIKAQRELAEIRSQIKLKGDALNQDIAKREKEESKKIGNKLKDAVFKVAEKAGYDLVIDASAVLYAKPQDDISKKVLDSVK